MVLVPYVQLLNRIMAGAYLADPFLRVDTSYLLPGFLSGAAAKVLAAGGSFTHHSGTRWLDLPALAGLFII
jgi:hypothetical protein